MSKIGAAFGQTSTKPSKTEIFTALHDKKLAEDAAAKAKKLGLSFLKFGRGRKGLGGKVVASIDDDEDVINRPGARKAKLLGS